MDGPRLCHTDLSKKTKCHILMYIYMESGQNGTDESICRSGRGMRMQRADTLTQGGKERMG